jgi:hypothetical protein
MDQKFELWLNVKITDRALAKKLESMCEADKRTRSNFVRLLIANEFDARTSAQEKNPMKKAHSRRSTHSGRDGNGSSFSGTT